jgi:hypothetical protein
MSIISTNDLKIIFSRIIDKLEFENIDRIDLEIDFYWYISAEVWQSFEQPPALLGSLKDDINSLKSLINDPERHCTYVDFDRVANVLKGISEKNNAV